MSKVLCKKLPIDGIVDNETLRTWLEEQARTWNLNYLLAHAEDGVIWGRFDSGKLTTAEQIFHQPEFNVDFPSLRVFTLQQCRIFGKNTEVMLWKVSQDDWKARSIEDKYLSEEDYISENQILWGTKAEKESNGFTLVSDGSQGLKHAVPLSGSFKGKDSRFLRLKVHHYIHYDDGVARIYLSRLVNLYFDSNT
jgi:CRISPR-associated protein (TIGR03984 family)